MQIRLRKFLNVLQWDGSKAQRWHQGESLKLPARAKTRFKLSPDTTSLLIVVDSMTIELIRQNVSCKKSQRGNDNRVTI